MKSIFQLGLAAVMACGISLSCLPSYADWHDSQRENRRASQDSRDAYQAQVKANRSARKGHHVSAYLHSRHAAHERSRAAKHRRQAKRERWSR
ncbi:hypothetical protein BH11CYA1_BH11CYA1_22770 [soil metagenome]